MLVTCRIYRYRHRNVSCGNRCSGQRYREHDFLYISISDAFNAYSLSQTSGLTAGRSGLNKSIILSCRCSTRSIPFRKYRRLVALFLSFVNRSYHFLLRMEILHSSRGKNHRKDLTTPEFATSYTTVCRIVPSPEISYFSSC